MSAQPINKKLLLHATADLDEREIVGEGSNPKIVSWLRSAGISWGGDNIPWCSAWMYDLVGRIPGAQRPAKRRAAARTWLTVGQTIDPTAPEPGDIVIFDRGRGRGHVGLFLRQTGKKILVLGGNQGNRVWPKYYSANKLLGVRRLTLSGPTDRISGWGECIRTIQSEGLNLFERKNADYGNSFERHGVIGTIIRMHDKMNRLTHIDKNGVALVNDESMRDTLIDLHVYTAIGVALMDNED